MIPISALTSILGGAGGGNGGGPLSFLGGATAGLVPAAFKFFSGLGQRRRAKAINPVDPGYQMNNQVIDNARILENRYNNYQMPGYGQALNNLQTNYATAYNQGVQGASSGGDVLDLATKLAYGQNQATNNLAYQSAQGQDAALSQYLNANAAAGDQYQQKNAYDRQQYDRKLAEKAALLQSGNENIYGALDQAGQVASRALAPRANTSDPSQLSQQQIDAIRKLIGGGSVGQPPMIWGTPDSNIRI